MQQAVRRAGVVKLATPHTLRHYSESPIIPSRLGNKVDPLRWGVLDSA